MSETPEPTEAAEESSAQKDARDAAREHDDQLVEEWGDESFPASDPPENY
ncbi:MULTISPECIES: hypothetical protein [unclassified Brevibacterium]|nr:hypothetical protein [Brevibacterium sp. W7.2]